MIVKSGKQNTHATIFVFCTIMVLFVMFCTSFGLYEALIATAVLLFIAARIFVSTGRTFIFDGTGCTVKFLWITKLYTWEELKVKRYADYRNSFGYKMPYIGGAEFSPRRIRKPKWMMPADYSLFVHPLSFIYVHFTSPDLSKNDLKNAYIYVVDRDAFESMLKDWGVPMDMAEK